MKYGVSRNFLLLTAGTVWLIAGINILRIGLVCWMADTSHAWFLKMGEASIVFLFFFGLIFQKVYHKHRLRISRKQEKNCPFSFFDRQGWLLMFFMITLGVTVRRLHLLPESFISVFYTGLSVALMATGVRFLRYGWRNKL